MKRLRFNLIFSGVICLCLWAALTGYFSVHQLLVPAEAAMRLACGALIADGARPYIDFLDNSSPYALYLAVIPQLISKLVFVHPICVFNMLVALLTLVALLLVLNCAKGDSPRLLLVQYCLPAIVIATSLTIFYFLNYFGQESVLFFLLFLPYLVQRYASISNIKADNRRLFCSSVIGVLAAIGLLLNPIFLLALLAVEFTCLFALGEISLTKIKRLYLTSELKACLFSLVLLCLCLFCLAPNVVREYLGPISQINQLAYEYYENGLSYVDKSPDRRDLVYAFVVFFVLALPVAGHCLLTRIMCVMSAFGFSYFVFTGTLLTHQGILMIAYSLTGVLLAGNRYLRSLYLGKKITAAFVKECEARLSQPNSPRKIRMLVIILPVCAIATFITTSFVSLKLAQGKAFTLRELGLYGFGFEHDLSFFSKTVREASTARQSVWIYSEQISPAFPLLTQLRRKPGFLVWGFPLHPLKILHERGTPEQVAQLAKFEERLYERLRAEVLSQHPPVLILIEDGEVRDLFKDHGITSIIDKFYGGLEDPCSPFNGDEIAAHAPYEYLGYRVPFSVDKLKK